MIQFPAGAPSEAKNPFRKENKFNNLKTNPSKYSDKKPRYRKSPSDRNPRHNQPYPGPFSNQNDKVRAMIIGKHKKKEKDSGSISLSAQKALDFLKKLIIKDQNSPNSGFDELIQEFKEWLLAYFQTGKPQNLEKYDKMKLDLEKLKLEANETQNLKIQAEMDQNMELLTEFSKKEARVLKKIEKTQKKLQKFEEKFSLIKFSDEEIEKLISDSLYLSSEDKAIKNCAFFAPKPYNLWFFRADLLFFVMTKLESDKFDPKKQKEETNPEKQENEKFKKFTKPKGLNNNFSKTMKSLSKSTTKFMKYEVKSAMDKKLFEGNSFIFFSAIDDSSSEERSSNFEMIDFEVPQRHWILSNSQESIKNLGGCDYLETFPSLDAETGTSRLTFENSKNGDVLQLILTSAPEVVDDWVSNCIISGSGLLKNSIFFCAKQFFFADEFKEPSNDNFVACDFEWDCMRQGKDVSKAPDLVQIYKEFDNPSIIGGLDFHFSANFTKEYLKVLSKTTTSQIHDYFAILHECWYKVF